MNNEQSELIKNGPSWLVRDTMDSGTSKGDDLGPFVRKRRVELVWGTWESKNNKDGLSTGNQIVGEVFHTLTGPTALRSMEAIADDYNRRSVAPSDKQAPKARIDGYKQSFSEAGGESLFDAMTLKQTISYDPKKAKANPF